MKVSNFIATVKDEIKQSAIPTLFASVVLSLGAAVWEKIESGGLIDALGGVSQRALEERVEEEIASKLKDTRVNFGRPQEAGLNEPKKAKEAVAVFATLAAQGQGQGAVCGYAAMDEASLREGNQQRHMRGAAPFEYRNGNYVPFGSFAMFVQKGEYWVVRECSGSALDREATVYFHELELVDRTPEPSIATAEVE